MQQLVIKNFDKGLITKIEDYSIPENAASKSLNWLTLGDKIELTGGYSVIGTEIATAGRVSGLHVASTVDGSTQPFYTYDQKILYYNNSTSAWVEIGTNQLGADADGEDVSFTEYVSLAGYQTWLSSPNSSLYKIMTANPGSIVDQYASANNFKGYIAVNDGRILLWNRDKNRHYLYGSWKDLQDPSVYTAVAAEAIGALGSANYTGTLAFKAGGARRTCFNVVFLEAGGETMTDNKDGTVTGDAGGTGTINYATGAYNITFNAVTAGAVTVNYEWEDCVADGLADFTFSTPRVANEGFFLPQATGGDLLNVLPYNTEYYCLHENNAWLFSLPISDTGPTNQIFRDRIGMPYWRSGVATGEGVYYIDTSNPSEPKFKVLSLESGNNEVIPILKSFNLDLTGYDFQRSVAYEWGDFLLFTCRVSGADTENRMFVYNKLWNTFDVTDYYVSCLADNAGVLWAGDSGTPNIMQLFTGFSANGSLINNYWEGKLTQLEIDELKKFKRLTIEGDIQRAQNLKVYIAYDRGEFVELGDISGSGEYVDFGQAVTIGSPQIGEGEVGGGGSITAHHYRREFRVKSQKFDEVKIKFVATDAGYVNVSTIDYYDIKKYGQKNLKRYRQTN
jgi:hypothetical protein